MKNLQSRCHTIKVFLDQDGYTAYFEEFPSISAGGETEQEALEQLMIALELALEAQETSKNKDVYSLANNKYVHAYG